MLAKEWFVYACRRLQSSNPRFRAFAARKLTCAALQHRILLHFGIPQDGVVSFSLYFGSRFVEVVVVVGDVSLEFFTPDFWGINRPDSA